MESATPSKEEVERENRECTAHVYVPEVNPARRESGPMSRLSFRLRRCLAGSQLVDLC